MFEKPRAKKKRTLSFANSRKAGRQTIQDQIDRIDLLTRTARTTWFGMLFFLTFVVVALLGVRDADFFLTDRETPLPLVGVSVPTFLFFAVTPLLGSVLYAYFHMHLLRLWEEIGSAPAKARGKALSEQIAPWLIIDLALAYRTDGALNDRPLRWASHWINLALAFWATPLVLLAFWYRSFVPHYDWLTLLACGGPVIFAIYVGTISWCRMHQLCHPKHRVPVAGQRPKLLLMALCASLTLIGWLRVEGTFANYAKALGVPTATVQTSWWGATFFPDLLYSAQLDAVNFSQTPAGWVSRELFREQFRSGWCTSVGIPAAACGPAPADRTNFEQKSAETSPDSRSAIMLSRIQFCRTLIFTTNSDETCGAVFAALDARFEADWLRQRELAERGLSKFDFEKADLRNVSLNRAQLQGADLSGAQLQGAELRRAQLQGADLFGAQLQGAKLRGAELQGAELRRAQLQGAELRRAQLQGAKLRGAELQGADLSGAQFDAGTDLSAATLRGAALRSVDFTDVPQIAAHLEGLFGDNTVTLPYSVARPARFDVKYESGRDFVTAWRAFQRSIGQDPDDPK